MEKDGDVLKGSEIQGSEGSSLSADSYMSHDWASPPITAHLRRLHTSLAVLLSMFLGQMANDESLGRKPSSLPACPPQHFSYMTLLIFPLDHIIT